MYKDVVKAKTPKRRKIALRFNQSHGMTGKRG